MKKIYILTNEQKEEIIHLFNTLDNNSSPFIADITRVKHWAVDEVITQYLLNKPKAIINEPEDIEKLTFHVSETEMISRSTDADIVERYNTRCYSAPDFTKRLRKR